MATASHWLSFIVFLPLLGVPALLCLRDEDHVWIRRVALVISLVEFVISLFLLPGFRMGQPDYQFAEYANWIGNAIHYHIGIDGLSLFLFFLFWELTLIPMYFMIGIWGHDRRIYAAVKFILYTMFGSILMLVAILWLYNLSNVHGTGTFDLPTLQAQLQHGIISLPPTTELLLFCAFFLAFAIKVPLGTYGIMRFCLPLFPYAAHRLAHIIGVLALIGIIYGALVATIQPNFKRLVAYTSVSHLGFVILGIFSFTTISFQGAIFQMISHGVSTGGLFLGLGMIYDRRHTYEIKEFGGLVNPMPIIMAFYLFIALSSLALPPLNGFIGEFLILIGVFQYHHVWAAFASSGAVLSAIYLLWSYQRVALGEVTVEKNRSLTDASGRERVILVTIAIAILFMGIASPLFTRRMEATTDNLVRQTQIEGAPQDAKAPTPTRIAPPAATEFGAPNSAGNRLTPAAPTQARLFNATTAAQVNP